MNQLQTNLYFLSRSVSVRRDRLDEVHDVAKADRSKSDDAAPDVRCQRRGHEEVRERRGTFDDVARLSARQGVWSRSKTVLKKPAKCCVSSDLS